MDLVNLLTHQFTHPFNLPISNYRRFHSIACYWNGQPQKFNQAIHFIIFCISYYIHWNLIYRHIIYSLNIHV